MIIGNTQSVIASHSCFCSFFTSHPYILSKYLQNVFIYYCMYSGAGGKRQNFDVRCGGGGGGEGGDSLSTV